MNCFYIGIIVRAFAYGLRDLGSIPGRVIPKTQKMPLCWTLSIVRYGSNVKWVNPGIVPSPTPWCSSYRKRSHRVTLDYCRQLYLLTLQILFKFEMICTNNDTPKHTDLFPYFISLLYFEQYHNFTDLTAVLDVL